MARLLTYPDGRLRTGRVTFLVFAGLLAVLSLLFKVNNSVDQAVLAVKHVFEPAPVEADKSPSPLSRDEAAIEAPGPAPEVAMKAGAAHNHREDKKEEAQPPDKPQDAAASPSQEMSADPPMEAAVAAPTEQKRVEISEAEARPGLGEDTPDASEEGQATADPTDQPRQPEKPSGEEPAAVEVASRPDAQVQEEPREKTLAPGPGFDRPALERLARLGKTEPPAGPTPEPGRIDISEKLTGPAGMRDKAPPPSKPKGIGTAAAPAKTGHVKADVQRGEMTVDPGQYMALFKSWRTAGNGDRETERIPLRVQNLRESYELFQMKPIAVVRGNTYLDLSDGARVSEAALTEYCTTLFLVDRPWDKWAEALTAAGVRRDETVEVRYYMYDFVKKAIYARVNQAVSWCRDEGLVAKALPAASLDVMGRAYVINRQGGGRFGVFVPVSVETKDGRTVAVDPACFRGQPDVEALHGAGLL